MKLAAKRLYIQEVGIRDGFQMETRFIPTERKIELIDQLSHTGLTKIEVTSFVSAKAVPAMADAEAVLAGITRAPGVEYTALVPNVRGAERALGCQLDEFNLVMSVSRGHGMANLGMTPEQSLVVFKDIRRISEGSGVRLNASLSTAFGCPFDGPVPAHKVLDLVARIEDLGISAVTLCDTTGMANPAQVAALCTELQSRRPGLQLTMHFHDTRAMGLANALAAAQTGVDRFDASLGGLGGCPFAPGATGNVCTEDLVHMFAAMGCETGIDLAALVSAAATLPDLVGHAVPGAILKAGPWNRIHPLTMGATAQIRHNSTPPLSTPNGANPC